MILKKFLYLKMEIINLVDNTRYCIIEDDDTKGYKLLDKKKFNAVHNYIDSINNPLLLKDFDNQQLEKNPKEDSYILKAGTKNGVKYIQTGNMIGTFYFKYKPNTKESLYEVNIGLRFDDDKNSNSALEYLLDYTTSIYTKALDYNQEEKQKKSKSNRVIEFLLTKLFINSLLKSSVMGLPKIYQEEEESSYNFKGRVDINRLIASELPFKGIMPHVKNEKVVIQSIASVILKAIDIIYTNKLKEINKIFSSEKKRKENKEDIQAILKKLSVLLPIKNLIKQSIQPTIITNQIIKEALNHRILNHPSFYEYRNTLFLASLILEGFKKPDIANMKGESFGYLVDISKVWENYLAELIRKNIDNSWSVIQEPRDLKLFKCRPKFDNFYENKMYPDIIVQKDKKIMIFDAKFKSSKWFNREDFYKTATYISYYQSHGYEVILSGQIYPEKSANDYINKTSGYLDSDLDFRFFEVSLMDIIGKPSVMLKFIEIINHKINNA